MIPLYKVYMPNGIKDQLLEIIYSGKISYGKFSKLFEKKIQEYIGNPLIMTTSTSNHALQIAFDVLELPIDSEVIASPMSCLASTQPILTNKLKVKWVDIDPSTGTLDPDEVKKNISTRTKAILHYHWCGYPGYIDEINKLGKENGLYVVEDATESFGAQYKNNFIGNTGTDIVCFNFGPVRLPNSIEGGAISFSTTEMYSKALLMRDYGIERNKFRDEFGEISSLCDIKIRGYGAMMNDINGFIGLKQMNKVPELLDKQKTNSEILKAAFDDISGISTIDNRNEILPSFWVYSLFTKEKNKMIDFLRKSSIGCSSVHLRNDIYTCFNNTGKSFNGTDSFINKNISIPSGWWTNTEDIIKSIKLFLSEEF